MPLILPNPMIAAGRPIEVVGSALSTETSVTTSHTVTIPDGPAGAMLVIGFRIGNAGTTQNTPSGWTLVDNDDSTALMSVFSRIDPGGLGSSVTITTGATRKSAAFCLRIAGHHSQIEGSIPNTTTLNPPSLSPSWGAARTLWIPLSGCGNGAEITGAPAGYSDNFIEALTSPSSNSVECAIGVSWRVFRTASENPGSFSADAGAERERAGLIAVR